MRDNVSNKIHSQPKPTMQQFQFISLLDSTTNDAKNITTTTVMPMTNILITN